MLHSNFGGFSFPRTWVNKGQTRKDWGVVPQPQVLVRYFS